MSALIKISRVGKGKSSVRRSKLKEVKKIKDKEMEKKRKHRIFKKPILAYTP